MNLLVEQMDVDNAYLNGDLHKEIYMTLPPGYPSATSAKGKMLLLQKGLYNLKQSARIWNEKFKHAIKKMGFTATTANSCIFIRASPGGMAIIALYVDDILIKAKLQSTVNHIKHQIHKEFKATEAGPVNLSSTFKSTVTGNPIP